MTPPKTLRYSSASPRQSKIQKRRAETIVYNLFMRNITVVLKAWLFGTACCGASFASSLSPVEATINALGTYDVSGAPPLSYFSNSADGVTVLATAVGLVPSVSAGGSITSSSGVGGATATLTYQFELVGPSGNVPIFIQGGVTSFVSDFESDPIVSAEAYVQVTGPLGDLLYLSTNSDDLGTLATSSCTAPTNGYVGMECTGAGIAFTGSDTITANVPYTVQLFANGGVVGFNYGATANASADPYIFIDPSFANANQYSILFSDGVSNSPLSTTPEPRSAALVCGALIMLIGLSAKRKMMNRQLSFLWCRISWWRISEPACNG
jgi:hypothetical protein